MLVTLSNSKFIIALASSLVVPQEKEEIIAEDYDDADDDGAAEEPSQYDYDEPVRKRKDNPWTANIKKRLTAGQIAGHKSCPNKYNVHHKCTLFCVTFWNGREKQPTEEYFLRKKRLLKRFPLPKHWVEVFDSGCAAHYYWDTLEDVVSWLPPTHPEAKVSKSAAMIRRQMEVDEEGRQQQQEGDQDSNQGVAHLPLPPTSEPPPPLLANIALPPPPASAGAGAGAGQKRTRNRDLDKAIRPRHERQGRYKPPANVDVFDPMDPASYSDIPRGKWSDGLEQENKKGGVDSTVTGTAFQQRPYPSPGAVLAAQRKSRGDEGEEGGEDEDDEGSDG